MIIVVDFLCRCDSPWSSSIKGRKSKWNLQKRTDSRRPYWRWQTNHSQAQFKIFWLENKSQFLHSDNMVTAWFLLLRIIRPFSHKTWRKPKAVQLTCLNVVISYLQLHGIAQLGPLEFSFALFPEYSLKLLWSY